MPPILLFKFIAIACDIHTVCDILMLACENALQEKRQIMW